jgi:hypothetical protein
MHVVSCVTTNQGLDRFRWPRRSSVVKSQGSGTTADSTPTHGCKVRQPVSFNPRKRQAKVQLHAWQKLLMCTTRQCRRGCFWIDSKLSTHRSGGRLVQKCLHSDWDLVPRRRTGVLGGSRSLRLYRDRSSAWPELPSFDQTVKSRRHYFAFGARLDSESVPNSRCGGMPVGLYSKVSFVSALSAVSRSLRCAVSSSYPVFP